MLRRIAVPALALAALAACGPTDGIIVGNDGVGARAERGNVRAQVGPDDSAVAVSGERGVAVVGSDGQAAAGVRVDDAPLVVGGGTPEGGGLFGGVGMGF